MKKLTFLAILLSVMTAGFSQTNSSPTISLIPQPVSMVVGKGNFVLSPNTVIQTGNNAELKKIANGLAKQVMTSTGYKLTISENKATSSKAITLSLAKDPSIPKEGYKLKVNASGISLVASDPSGIFYGVQTLLQLLPKQIENSNVQKSVKWEVPFVSIEDHPRFGWRGLMLDVSRHFFTRKDVEDYIDEMVKYKFNILHWHLTDDQGWRIEIKSLPRLTSVGAWRVNKTGTFGSFSTPAEDEPRDYGGFYTQDDIREVVQYAKDRYVNILPEVDIPGHSLAAIASYPDLACTPGTYHVNSGEEFMIWPPGAHFYGLVDNSLCPANENVYDFLDKVFTEVASLFPFEYIHTGGDECARNFWEKSDAIKALMQKENLKDLDEVQSYFVKRVEKIIESKGKKQIGWDEILQGGLAANAAVMSWRGMKGGIEAARQGHQVVMSPTDFVYLDYMQGDKSIEPPVYATLRLKKVYQFEPVPDSIDASLIKGGQANLWTEQVYNMRHAQYMTWPRAFAVSEVLWSPKEKKNWNDFTARVEKQFQRLDEAGIKYAPSMYDAEITSKKDEKGALQVILTPEIEGLTIHYSFDNSIPDQYYPAYSQPLSVPKDASFLKLISYRNQKPIGRLMVVSIDDLKKRAGIIIKEEIKRTSSF